MCQTSVNLVPCCINTHQGPSGTKAPRLCRSILSLQKIAHEMWHDSQFSQRNRPTERTVGVGIVGDREVRGVGGRGQNLEKG